MNVPSLNENKQQEIFAYLENRINDDLPLATTIQTTLDKARQVLNIDRLVIYQIDTKAPEIHSNIEESCSLPETINRVTYESIASANISSILHLQLNGNKRSFRRWQKYLEGFVLVINDIEQSNLSPSLLMLMGSLKVKAKLAVPIRTNKLWGLLIAHQCSCIREWTQPEVKFLNRIAQYLAIAINKSQSYTKLQQQKKELEQQVENQAHQIADALVAAKVASQSKHEFLGNISHELKTPLTRVIGLSGTLLHWSLSEGRTPLPAEKQQQYLKTIQDSGKHLLKLIERILEFSEVQSGKHLLNAQNVSLFDLSKEIVNSLQQRVRSLGLILKLDYRLTSEFDSFYGDRHRLEEILLNLLDNAFKFTPASGEVVLRLWQENRQIAIEVEDTGIGISQQQLPLLFEGFSPSENFRQKIHEGAGIGLALTKHLVELHGGSIEVESQLGEGSIFRIYLPISTAVGSQLSSASQRVPRQDLNNKIMLISRDEETATSLCQSLTTAEYKVMWLIDTVTAINQISFLKPKLIILDRDNLKIEIPDVRDALAAIEAIDTSRLILLYSQMEKSEWEHFQDVGIVHRFSKSANISLLVDTIAKVGSGIG